MAGIQFNARNGISVGTTPLNIIDNLGAMSNIPSISAGSGVFSGNVNVTGTLVVSGGITNTGATTNVSTQSLLGVMASVTGAIAGTTLTISAGTTTGIAVGQFVTGVGVTPGTTVVSGSANSWVITPTQTVASTTIYFSNSDIAATNGGVILKGTTDKSILWTPANGWTSSENINIASGKLFSINGTSVLSSTTLGASVLSSSLNSVGNVTVGTWSAGIISATFGGTGVNNGANTLTLAGNISHLGAFSQSFTATAPTALILPTTGTLATLVGAETISNKNITLSTASLSSLTVGSGGIGVNGSAGVPSTSISVGGTTTAQNLILVNNTGNNTYIGVDSSIGGAVITGSSAYDMIVRSGNGGISFSTDGGVSLKARLSTTGLIVNGNVNAFSTTANNNKLTVSSVSTTTGRVNLFSFVDDVNGFKCGFGVNANETTQYNRALTRDDTSISAWSLSGMVTKTLYNVTDSFQLQYMNGTGAQITPLSITPLGLSITGTVSFGESQLRLMSSKFAASTVGNNLFIGGGGQLVAYDGVNAYSGSYNSFYGVQAGFSNTTGFNNSFNGFQAGYFNTTGYQNSFFGIYAGFSNTTGYQNSFFGLNSGYSNTTGYTNSFYGVNAGYLNTTGYQNSFNGFQAGYLNTTGINNSFFGLNSGFSNTTGFNNSFNGLSAGYSNTTGYQNSFHGLQAGFSNTTGNQNSFFGMNAGYDLNPSIAATSMVNGTVYRISTLGTTNFVTYGAVSNTLGLQFTATGAGTGTGTVGLVTDNNTMFGYNTGRGIISGNGNTIVGANVTGLAAALTNNIILANGTGAIKYQHDGTNAVHTGGLSVTGTVSFGESQIRLMSSKFAASTTGNNLFIGSGGQLVAYDGVNAYSGSYNSFYGANAGYFNTTGYNNSFNGYQAGYLNTTGYSNSFFGMNAGYSNTTGYQNSFNGTGAGYYNTTGSQNSFFGTSAGYSNTTGYYNSFFGWNAGVSNTTGYNNSFNGFQSGYFNTTGYQNSFFGLNSGYSNTTGTNNAFFGSSAGYLNTTGSQNSFFGMSAGYSNTTGSNNSFNGFQAGYFNTTGYYNSFFGWNAGFSNTTGYQNSFYGMQAGYSNTTGSQNSFFGIYAGYDLNPSIAATSMVNGTVYRISTLGTTNFVTYGAVSNTLGLQFTANGAGTGTGTVGLVTDNNTMFGYNTGRGIISGNGNTIIGANVTGLAAGLTNNIILANGTGAIKYQHDGTNAVHTGGITVTGTVSFGESQLRLMSSKFAASTTGNNLFIGSGGQLVAYDGVNAFSGSYNSFFGFQAGYLNTTGYNNSFNGTNAGFSNTTGFNNSFNGTNAGFSNTTGFNNSFNGTVAGYSNTTGINNSFFGGQAGYYNTTGSYNSFNGYQSGYYNTTGYQNSFYGMQAGFSNTTGYNNSFNGLSAGYSNTIGIGNSFHGLQAGFSNTTGYQNSFFGIYAGYDLNPSITATSMVNGTVYRISTLGTTNFMTYGAASNTLGLQFTANGAGTGTGTVGLVTDNNTLFGYNTGRGIVSGNGNTIIGANVTALAAGLTNNIILANGTGVIKYQHDGTNAVHTGSLSVTGGLSISGASTLAAISATTGAFSGVITAPSPQAYDRSTSVANTAFVAKAVNPPVRQTVLNSPVDLNGKPAFLPATSASLIISTQGLGVGTSTLTITAAQGFGRNGAINVVGYEEISMTWPACTANATNYLPVLVNENGTLTPQTPVILQPIYQWGGTPSIVSGQYTFNIQQMIMYLGNGASASPVSHVIVGECLAGASNLTLVFAYALQGRSQVTFGNWPPANASTLAQSYIGHTITTAQVEAVNMVGEGGYVVGESIIPYTMVSNFPVPVTLSKDRLYTGFTTGAGPLYMTNKATGILLAGTPSNWKCVITVTRNW